MHNQIIFIVLFLIGSIHATSIPFIQNVSLISLTPSNSTTLYNVTCDQCLCRTISTHAVVNCFPNKTCQQFLTVPFGYQIEPTAHAHLYFPNGKLPNRSQCCTSSITKILTNLQNATQISTNNSFAYGLYLDNENVLFTTDRTSGYLFGYDANNLTIVSSIYLNGPFLCALAYNDGYFYIGWSAISIIIINKTNLAIVNTISSSILLLGDIIFLQKGEIMAVTSYYTNSIVFFRRENNSPTNYTYFFHQTWPSISIYSLHYLNDTFFFGVSWLSGCLYSFTQVNSTFWQPTCIVNTTTLTNSTYGGRMSIDHCGRIWLTRAIGGIVIVDQQGTYLGSFISNSITDARDILITRNNVLYVADVGTKRIVRIDPNIPC